MAPRTKPPPPRPHNPLRGRRDITAPFPGASLIRKATAQAAVARPAKRLCPNKECATPKIEDGTCINCGTIIDDSNIVSELTFSENSSGAAVVQGSFVSADSGGARSLGPAFRRAGADDARESTVREGRRHMQAMASQLGIQEGNIQEGMQIFKLAALNNFIQGRRMDMVAAVCLYSACRKNKPCKVMLIDFADKIQVNVFKLGHTFKSLHNAITLAKDGIQPVLPEDLIYRFAMKLEFGLMLNRVAEDAVRMVQRMSLDWMVMGRRPSGVCGACLILAARMNNFRRTITEVVYVVKVTTHTIQKRLDEFKLTPSSALTVEEFLNNEFLESAHDPPSFYEQTEEFQKTKKKRKRRKRFEQEEEEDQNSSDEDSDGSKKRQKTATPGPSEVRRDADGFVIPAPPAHAYDIPIDPDLIDAAIEDQTGSSFHRLVAAFGEENVAETIESADATEVTRASLQNLLLGPERASLDNAIYDSLQVCAAGGLSASLSEEALSSLKKWLLGETCVMEDDLRKAVQEWTEPMENASATGLSVAPNEDNAQIMSAAVANTSVDSGPSLHIKKGSRKEKVVHVSKEWENAENNMAEEISEMINDPNTIDHATNYARAVRRAAAHMLYLEKINPSKEISMDVLIGEDEFKDDPEVANCLMTADQVAAKEKLWVNMNKGWLRKQQMKQYQKRMAEQGPPKARRNRTKKPKIGEGQTSAASSPGEAAVNVMKERCLSKKINYDAINAMFANVPGAGSALGSATTSRVTSRAGSVAGSRASSVMSSEADTDTTITPTPKIPTANANVHAEEDSDPDSDDDDYVKPPTAKPAEIAPEEEEDDDWRGAITGARANNIEDDESWGGGNEDDFEDYSNGDVDDENLGNGFGGGYNDE